ncbi:prepilin peptidase [Carnobacterium pleistocenium]|uniref:prepilin peptidase n=1 Tax=Carnobacterium pleistocenium TaxID=181073 RepID=UPI00068D4AFA|nr:A24 family peptidase [Carnobacterium pleistocenium]
MQVLILYLLIWFTGGCFGSFLMVVGLRVPIHQSIVFPRSHCSTCHRTLRFYELIPILSYLIQKGRCRNCQQRISILHPLAEALTGFIFLYTFHTYLFFPKEGLFIIGFISFGIIFIISDIYYQLLPDRLILFFFLWVFLGRLVIHPFPFSIYLFSGFGFFSFFYLLYQFSSTPIGGGDIKLFGIIGLLLGYDLTLVAIMIACLSALLFSFPLLVSKRITSKHPIPFAPFIFFGTILTYFSQDIVTTWFMLGN